MGPSSALGRSSIVLWSPLSTSIPRMVDLAMDRGGVNYLRGLDGYQQNEDAGDKLMYEGIVLEEPNKLGEEGVGLEDRGLR